MEEWFNTGPRFQKSRVRILILLLPVLSFFFATTCVSSSLNCSWVVGGCIRSGWYCPGGWRWVERLSISLSPPCHPGSMGDFLYLSPLRTPLRLMVGAFQRGLVSLPINKHSKLCALAKHSMYFGLLHVPV